MASFDEKVEALRRLRERRQARDREEAEKDAESSKQKIAAEATAEPSPEGCSQSNGAPAKSLDKQLDGQDLTAVLEHYAKIGEPMPAPTGGDERFDGGSQSGESEQQAKHGGDEGDALYCLGHCYEQGLHECGEDKAKAAVYYRMAAEKGCTVAQWRLGHLHEYGEGVERRGVQAARWYRLAAEAGHPQAQSSLALLLEDGGAGIHDDAEALRWHLEAAAQGQALSQYCAARCLAEGRGAEKDEVAAKALLEKSAAAGFPLALDALAHGTWLNTEPCKDDDASEDSVDHDACGDDSLLDMATRIAKQIGHLSDADADSFLDELLGSLDDPSELDNEQLQDLLTKSKFSPDHDFSGGYPTNEVKPLN